MEKREIIAVAALAIMMALAAGCSKSPVNPPQKSNGSTVLVYLFWGDGCPLCAAEEQFLLEIGPKYNLDVRKYEVWHNQSNMEIFRKMAAAYGVSANGVPMTFIGESYFVGFSDAIKSQIESKIIFCTEYNCTDPGEKLR